MNLHSWSVESSPEFRKPNRFALIFGIGLIGHAISSSLTSTMATKTVYIPFSWDSENLRRTQELHIFKLVEKYVIESETLCEIDIIWSAGRAGFGGDDEVFQAEQLAFDTVIRIAKSIVDLNSISGMRFHLFSSAGGLFEGQRKIHSTSQVNPIRPYGYAKFNQENLTRQLPSRIVTLIYRPSSVYGTSGTTSRIGLITAVLTAVYKNSTARIYAQPDTLRDYIFSNDIGKFVTSQIVGQTTTSHSYLVASGKASSTIEILSMIENLTDRKISVQFEISTENVLPNTYQQDSIPKGLIATPIETGIYLTAMRLRDRFNH